MAYENAALDLALSAAAGGDGDLFAELRSAFVASATLQVDLLRRSRCDGNWNLAAMRLRSLGASFHAEHLVALAEEALEAAPGEPVVVRKLEQFVSEVGASCS